MKYAPTHSQNDNDADSPLPFVSLAALTANVVNYLASAPRAANLDADEKDGHGDADRKSRDEEYAKANRNYVDQRLRDIRAFEEIARGVRRRPRRGPAGVNLVKR